MLLNSSKLLYGCHVRAADRQTLNHCILASKCYIFCAGAWAGG